MTYKQAEEKIFDAYFKDEIKPFDASFCFCGTLSPNSNWRFKEGIRENIIDAKFLYSHKEYEVMEYALMRGFPEVKYHNVGCIEGVSEAENSKNFEDNLFKGMCAALEVLKQIHISRGEVIEETEFKQRTCSKQYS